MTSKQRQGDERATEWKLMRRIGKEREIDR